MHDAPHNVFDASRLVVTLELRCSSRDVQFRDGELNLGLARTSVRSLKCNLLPIRI
jgi:hypothetical protein